MTLPSNFPSAEPSAIPGDSFAGLGLPVSPAATATLPATPFASLLTQADATGTGAAVSPLAGETAPAVVALAPTAPLIANPPALYPGVYYMPFVGPQAAPLIAPCTGQPQATGPGVPQTGFGATAKSADDMPVPPRSSSPKEKQNFFAQPETTSKGEADQGAMQLAYQWVAGQWVPQSLAQPPAPQLPATENSKPQVESGVAPATLAVAGGTFFQSDQPVQPEQKRAQRLREPVGVQTEVQPSVGVAPTTTQKDWAQATSAVGELKESASEPQPQKLAQEANEPVLSGTNISKSAPLPESAKQAVGFITSTATTTTAAVLKPTASAPVAAEKTPPESAKPSAQNNATGTATTDDLPTSDTGVQSPTPTWRFAQSRPTTQVQTAAPEKFAAPMPLGRLEFSSGVNPLFGTEEKKTLSIDDKVLAPTKQNIGTDVANREIAMSSATSSKAPSVDFSTIIGGGLRPGEVTAVAPAAAPAAAHAPKLVQEIREIADRISVIDRNSVEVRFDFSDTDRLSVRVEYRDGTVHTTFRTDSAPLRDAISHEWQTQTTASEQRSYRVAEPVFSQTASDRQNYSSLGDGSGRQRAFEQPAQTATPAFATPGRNAGSTSSPAVPAARSARPETSLHLHALA